MTKDQYKDFLTQSLDVYATSFGVDQKLAKDMKKALVNFLLRPLNITYKMEITSLGIFKKHY